MNERLLAIGADGARGGCLAVACYGESRAENEQRRTEVSLCASLDAVVALRATLDVPVAVDIPMGLLDIVEPRPCDKHARKLLGQRASTVFTPPSRPLLAAASYAKARALVQELRKTNPAANSLSAQAFGIAPKVKEVDDWLTATPGAQARLYECHPELSFRAMAGDVLANKKTPHGQVDRLRLVQREFPDALDVVAKTTLSAKQAQLADVLDAYAAASSALHVAVGDFEELGGEKDSVGLIMRIVF